MRLNHVPSQTPPLDDHQPLRRRLAEAGIVLEITRKRVKNINFRLRPHILSVSAPHYASDKQVMAALARRIQWAIAQHAVLLKRQSLIQSPLPDSHSTKGSSPSNNLSVIRLWGQRQSLTMSETERINWYRRELQRVMPDLFAKWQPIVGAYANEMRIKKMSTRWGSCNTRAKRIWLSVYLPAYPIECTEYVIVHELCHLHHANHSTAFWNQVKHAMPDYKRWHDMLAGKSILID